MTVYGPLGRLGAWTAGHFKLVLLTWVAIAVGLGAFAPKVEHALSGAGWEANGSESVAAREAVDASFAGQGSYALLVAVHGQGDLQPAIAQATKLLEADPRVSRVAPAQRSRDGRTAILSAGAAAGPTWPLSAPTAAQMTTAANDLGSSITSLNTIRGDLSQASDLKDTRVGTGQGYMRRVDEATDFLYGPESATKLDFGLTPRGQGTQEALHKLIEIVVTDGPVPGSLKFDWENIEGASYEVQWSSTSNFATVTGSATSASSSDYIISGLTPGTQYWMRVRPVRGADVAPWSDPATRVAPV